MPHLLKDTVHPQWIQCFNAPRLLLSVMTDCCSLSGHQCCLSLLRAPPGSDRETAGPRPRIRRTLKWHWIGCLVAMSCTCTSLESSYLVQVTSHPLPLILFRLQLGQSHSKLGFQLELKHILRTCCTANGSSPHHWLPFQDLMNKRGINSSQPSHSCSCFLLRSPWF